eukprot:Skav224765  [mRNA]  locus=scaffold1604:492403:494175:+ [translate_table: standard]
MGQHLSSSSRVSVQRAGNTNCLKNSERDLHRLFQSDDVQFGSEKINYLSLKGRFKYLLKEHPIYLLGGFTLQDPRMSMLLSSFWASFETNYPDHEVFQIHGGTKGQLHRCIPFYLHTDAGVGARKSAVLVVNMQAMFGRSTAQQFQEFHTHVDSHNMQDIMLEAQRHNAHGSTYLTRFLWTALPKQSYSGKNEWVYWKILEMLTNEVCQLMRQGVKIAGETYFPICVGLKGDQPALIKAGKFKRSFMNLAVDRGCCWECLAGFKDFPFEDTSATPKWSDTVGLVAPWDPTDPSPSPLLKIPCQPDVPHGFFKRDAFHAFKQTIGGHFGASIVVLFAIDFGLWTIVGQSRDVDTLFQRAFKDFEFFVRFEWRRSVMNHAKSFTRQTLHFGDHKKFPYARWKGSDTMLIMRWLRQLVLGGPVRDDISRDGVCLIQNPLKANQSPFFQAVLEGCEASINFFHALHRGGVWLDKPVAMSMSQNCRKFCDAYNTLALLCHNEQLARFHLEPSLHTFRHFACDIDQVLDRGCQKVLSPATTTCEMDEDFVGKVCRISRHVHAKSMCARTIDRYMLRCRAEIKKDQDGTGHPGSDLF